MKPIPDKRALTVGEAARYACVSRGTIDNWLNKGVLACEELPQSGMGIYHFRRIRKHDLDVFLDAHHTGQTPSAPPASQKPEHHTEDVFLLPRNT